ncbi:MAG: ATP-binding protein, partial [Novipirellula sp. JB048]
MEEQEFAAMLMETFLQELHEHLATLNHELLAMEQEQTPEQLGESWKTIFRAAHTLKGAAAAVAVQPIQFACHDLEDIFGFYRDRGPPAPTAMTSRILKVIDAIEEVGDRVRNQEDLDDSPLVGMLPELKRSSHDLVERGSLAAESDETDSRGEDDAPLPVAADPDPDADADVDADVDGGLEDSRSKEAVDAERDHAIDLFLGEVEGPVAILTSSALQLENAGSEEHQLEQLDLLFNATRSLHQAAAAARIDVIHETCDRLQTLLSNLHEAPQRSSAEHVSRILEVANAITDAAQRLRAHESLESAPIQRIAAKLNRAIAAMPHESPARELAPDADADTDADTDAAADAAADIDASKRTAATDRSSAVPQSVSPTPASSEDSGSTKDSGSTGDSTPSAPPAASGVSAPVTAGDSSGTSSRDPSRDATRDTTWTASITKANRKRVVLTDSTASIRVPAQKLDALLTHSGELLVARGRFSLRAKEANELRDLASNVKNQLQHSQRKLRQSAPQPKWDGRETTSAASPRWFESTWQAFATLSKKIDGLAMGLESDNRLLGQTCSQLDDEIYRVRMLPLGDACGGLERAARDIATSTNKKVHFQIEGADIEVDRSVLEGLKDPLLHLVRNAVDHGIEKPAVRMAAGKPETAVLSVSAALRGGHVEVQVRDDGAGFDLSRIRAIATQRGIEVPEDRRAQTRLVFAPGFSTAKMITDISGRGVGLDVVQSRVESLHGTVDVSFSEGKGTCFTLVVPLTLTTIRCLLVVANEQIYAIPTTAAQRLVRFGIHDVRTSMGRDTLLLHEAPTSLVSLAATLGMKSKGLIAGKSSKGVAVILAAGEQRVVVEVDDILAEQDVLVKNLGPRIRRLQHFSGCTLLPSGQIALVLNASNVVRSALGLSADRTRHVHRKPDTATRKKLLLVDDSVTTR